MKKVILSVVTSIALMQSAFAKDETPRDQFFWLSQINKASIVTKIDQKIITQEQGEKFAKALDTVIKNGNKEGAKRPTAALRYEPLLIKEAGHEITLIHAGRSSQDMHATYRAAIFRDNLLKLSNNLNQVSTSLLKLASENMDTIVPNYTNGVMAQPNVYAHYLLAFAEAFERDAERIKLVYDRFNSSAMGTTVLNGTSWDLDRERMAEYLGFDRIVDNAYDAAQIISVEQSVDIGTVIQNLSIHIGMFIEDIMPQYSQSRPWILIGKGGTYTSTAMPQKRNPGLINTTRRKASMALSSGIEAVITAHNITPGLTDPKMVSNNGLMLERAMDALKSFNKVVSLLKINPERALEEVNSDWVTSQELADVLMRDHKVPFRVGHHYASELVNYGRANGIRPLDFPYDVAKKIYEKEASKHDIAKTLPLSEKEFRKVLDPIYVIKNRKTSGGPQASELERMLKNAQETLAENKKWVKEEKASIESSLKELDKDFTKLLK